MVLTFYKQYLTKYPPEQYYTNPKVHPTILTTQISKQELYFYKSYILQSNYTILIKSCITWFLFQTSIKVQTTL